MVEWRRDSPHFTGDYHHTVHIRMDRPVEEFQPGIPLDLWWPSASNCSGNNNGSSWVSEVLTVRVTNRGWSRRKFGNYGLHHLGGGTAVTIGRHDILMGTPRPGWHCGVGVCISQGSSAWKWKYPSYFQQKEDLRGEIRSWQTPWKVWKNRMTPGATPDGELVPLLRTWGSRGQQQSGRGQEHITRPLSSIWGTQLLLSTTVTGAWTLDAESGSPASPGLPGASAEATGRPHLTTTFQIIAPLEPSRILAAKESVKYIFYLSRSCHSGRHTKSKVEWSLNANSHTHCAIEVLGLEVAFKSRSRGLKIMDESKTRKILCVTIKWLPDFFLTCRLQRLEKWRW